jgi:hypothetical protein
LRIEGGKVHVQKFDASALLEGGSCFSDLLMEVGDILLVPAKYSNPIRK